jgi:hypothetical protein
MIQRKDAGVIVAANVALLIPAEFVSSSRICPKAVTKRGCHHGQNHRHR